MWKLIGDFCKAPIHWLTGRIAKKADLRKTDQLTMQYLKNDPTKNKCKMSGPKSGKGQLEIMERLLKEDRRKRESNYPLEIKLTQLKTLKKVNMSPENLTKYVEYLPQGKYVYIVKSIK